MESLYVTMWWGRQIRYWRRKQWSMTIIITIIPRQAWIAVHSTRVWMGALVVCWYTSLSSMMCTWNENVTGTCTDVVYKVSINLCTWNHKNPFLFMLENQTLVKLMCICDHPPQRRLVISYYLEIKAWHFLLEVGLIQCCKQPGCLLGW